MQHYKQMYVISFSIGSWHRERTTVEKLVRSKKICRASLVAHAVGALCS